MADGNMGPNTTRTGDNPDTQSSDSQIGGDAPLRLPSRTLPTITSCAHSPTTRIPIENLEFCERRYTGCLEKLVDAERSLSALLPEASQGSSIPQKAANVSNLFNAKNSLTCAHAFLPGLLEHVQKAFLEASKIANIGEILDRIRSHGGRVESFMTVLWTDQPLATQEVASEVTRIRETEQMLRAELKHVKEGLTQLQSFLRQRDTRSVATEKPSSLPRESA